MNDNNQLSPLQRAALVIEKMQAKLDALEYAKTEPIAIIGLGCRLPGNANDMQAFWRLLHEGVDAITSVPSDRWNSDDLQLANFSETTDTQYGGFLRQIDLFDPQFFEISPREAASMDPQHRLLLEVSWEALENAGLTRERLTGTRSGVFVGITSNEYTRQFDLSDLEQLDVYFITGNVLNAAAGRLSYILGLQGPSMAIDTACSSSLVAVHQACQSLRNGDCDLALTGGVNLILSPISMMALSQADMLAADGHCKTFDAAADGLARGEGCGIIVLKRLKDAKADGDNILALIRGSAVNQDGASSSLTVPNGVAQQRLIRQALENAKVAPSEVDYVEAHGTGTALGDPIEVNALASVLGEGRLPSQPVKLGSVKTNVGHLESAAGVTGLIKVVLALQQEEIPPHLHFKQPNPHIPWDELPVKVPTEPTPWPAGEKRRIAGVSAFGVTGTNAHIVVEEAPKTDQASKVSADSVERPLHLLTLSAKTETALLQLAERYEKHFATHPALAYADICFSANTGRSHFNHRLGVVASSVAQAQDQLIAFIEGQTPVTGVFQNTVTSTHRPHKIAFLFTGQGSQYVNMGLQLYETQQTFRQTLEHCDEILRPYLEKSLLEVLYPAHDAERQSRHSQPEVGNENSFGNENSLDETAYTQPALFALEYALAQLWQSWGIEPDVVMGHSVGEYVAACVAGVFSLEDGLKLIAARGRLMQTLCDKGDMLVLSVDENKAAEIIQPYAQDVAIAAINGPENVVISGKHEAIEAIMTALSAEEEIKIKRLSVSHAFHSPMMEPMLAEFKRVATEVTYAKPEIPLCSNVTGQLATAEIATPAYWCRHVRQPVRFAASMETLYQQDYEIFVEIGPKPSLLGMGRMCLPDDVGTWLVSLRQGEPDWEQLLQSLGELYVRGVSIDWFGFDKDYLRNKVLLPIYPFQRQRYWVDTPQKKATLQQTAILNLLQEGDTEQLTQQLKQVEQLSDEEVKLLPKLLGLLVKQHQQQVTADAIKEWLYQIEWQSQPRPSALTEIKSTGCWLILADQGGVGQALAKLLKGYGEFCQLAYAGSAYQNEANNLWSLNPAHLMDFERLFSEAFVEELPPLRGIVHLWSLDGVATSELTTDSLTQAQVLSCGSVLHLLQTQAKYNKGISPRLWLVTRNAVSVRSPPASLAVAQATLWGLGKVIALEHPELWGGIIDLPPIEILQKGGEENNYLYLRQRDEEAADLLAEIWSKEEEDQISYRGGQRYVARLVRSYSQSISSNVSLRADSSYLITGGLGALGLKIAQWLVEQGGRYLILTGRRGASSEAQEILNQLAQAGTKIVVSKADVSLQPEIVSLFQEINTQMPPLRGVIHAAGVLDDGILIQQNWARFSQVMAAKVEGSWNLHTLTQTMPLDFFVCFSSAASLWGGSGQGNYAAANAFMDALAHYRHAQGLSGLSVNWGPWAEVGMAANLESHNQSRLTELGIDSIAPENGLQLLGALIGQVDTVQVGALPVNWSKFLQQFPTNQVPAFLSDLAHITPSQLSSIKRIEIKRQLEAASEKEYERILTEYLQAELARVLKMNPSQVDEQQLLNTMGLDSLMAVELRNRVRNELDIDIPISNLMAEISVIELAMQLKHQFKAQSSTEHRDDLLLITPVSRKEPLPLSFAQQEIWFFDQLEGSSAVDNIPIALRLEGLLHRDALEQSFQALVQRHDSLRTFFPIVKSTPVVQASVINPPLSIIHLQDLPPEEQTLEVQRLINDDAQYPFDLSKNALFRTTLLQLGVESHILLLNMHHIIGDGWSFRLLIREFSTLYKAFLQGEQAFLPPLPIQYVDFAHWQQQWLTGEVFDKQLNYWKQQLAGAPALFELPIDHPRPPVQGVRGASLFLSLSPPLTARLKTLSQQAGSTLFMTLLSALGTLFSRYSGQTDIVIGTLIANRTHSQFESVVGLFLNTLVLRLNLEGNPPFDEVLQQARRVTLEAYAHQELPFIQLVEALQPNREPSHLPLFQVMFDPQDLPMANLELPGLKIEPLIQETSAATYDLELMTEETDQGLVGTLLYNTDLFERATIERMIEHFQTLLEGIVENPQQPIHDIPLFTEGEEQLFRERCALSQLSVNSEQLSETENLYLAPRTSEEELLAWIWAAALGVEKVGIHDNFFELGGHSMLAAQVMLRIGEAFSCELPLRLIFESQTIAGLSEHLRNVQQ